VPGPALVLCRTLRGRLLRRTPLRDEHARAYGDAQQPEPVFLATMRPVDHTDAVGSPPRERDWLSTIIHYLKGFSPVAGTDFHLENAASNLRRAHHAPRGYAAGEVVVTVEGCWLGQAAARWGMSGHGSVVRSTIADNALSGIVAGMQV
jgi:hypothetical protein